MNLSVQTRDEAALARRQALLINSPGVLVRYAVPGTTTVTSSAALAITFDYASTGFYVAGRPIRLNLRGKFGAISGGSAAAMEVKVHQPDGTIIATQRVPFSDTGGFQLEIEVQSPSDSKYWIYYQAVGVSASPTWAVSLQEINVYQYPGNTIKVTM